MTVGIDGGSLCNWHQKNTNFDIIAGKSFSKTQASKRFGLVQQCDDNLKRRLMHVLTQQGMQANQQITFLSDGANNLRNLQEHMYPESEHVLDWFHLIIRITVLTQFAKELEKSDSDHGKQVRNNLESTKWYLWHGNVGNALDQLEACYLICDDEAIRYENQMKFLKHLSEMETYIRNNRHLIANYGRSGDTERPFQQDLLNRRSMKLLRNVW